MPELSLDCSCGANLCQFDLNQNIDTTEKLNAYLKSQAGSVRLWCNCGRAFLINDDGTPVDQGGSVVLGDVSRPVIASIDVATGPAAGGTVVTVTGLSFSVLSPTVKFGGVAGLDLQVINDTTLTVESPAGTAGTVVDVSVENANGEHPTMGRLPEAFTYS